MSEQTQRRFRVALIQEIGEWQKEGLIEADTAATLAAHYPVAQEGSRIITILLTIGVVLVGLGILLFVGANWSSMSRLAKVGVLVASVVSSYAGAWWCRYEPGNRPKLGAALLLLGTLLYGASIWLISQLFNFDTSLCSGLTLWALGTAAITLLTESRATAVLLALMVPAWNFSYIGNGSGFDLDWGLHAWSANALVVFLCTTAAAAIVCNKTRSTAALYCLLIVSALWLPSALDTYGMGMILFGVFLFGTHLWLEGKHKLAAGPVLYVGVTTALLGCFITTLDHHFGIRLGGIQSVNAFILMALALIPTLRVLNKNSSHKKELISCMVIVAIVSLIGLARGAESLVPINNLLLLGLIAAVITAGVRLQKPALINMAIVFAVIDIITRYFDMFYPMMNRSLFFIGGGLLLVCAGAIAERNRRKLTGSMTTRPAEAI